MATVIFLLVFDALNTGYQVDAIVVSALLGSVMTMLGLEAITNWRRPDR